MEENIQEFISSLIVIFLLGYSVYLWIDQWRRRFDDSTGTSDVVADTADAAHIDRVNDDQVADRDASDVTIDRGETAATSMNADEAPSFRSRVNTQVFVVAFLWVALQLTNRIVLDLGMAEEATDVSLQDVQATCALNLGLWALLGLLLTDMGSHPLSRWGAKFPPTGRDVEIGVRTFLLSLAPVFFLLWVTYPLRTAENQHSFLQLLRDDSSPETFLWLILAAAVLAPLTEELIFRVILQGWLADRMSRRSAVIGTALIFAGVHGWPDCIPLIPLALVLGYTYERYRNYTAIVLAHALFNALNLILSLQ